MSRNNRIDSEGFWLCSRSGLNYQDASRDKLWRFCSADVEWDSAARKPAAMRPDVLKVSSPQSSSTVSFHQSSTHNLFLRPSLSRSPLKRRYSNKESFSDLRVNSFDYKQVIKISDDCIRWEVRKWNNYEENAEIKHRESFGEYERIQFSGGSNPQKTASSADFMLCLRSFFFWRKRRHLQSPLLSWVSACHD